MNRRIAAVALLATVTAATAQNAPPLKTALELGVEARAFLQSPAYRGQKDGGLSVFVQPEIDKAIPRGNLRAVAFARWDSQDDERSHFDLRELNLRQRYGAFDWVAGIDRVFWGVTESVHLVDIINQTDLVENPDGEDKLGQPMLSLAWTTPAGVFTGYVLPGFRERTLPGDKGRLRAPIAYDTGNAIYQSGAEDKRIDGALRWALSRGALDLGISHFSGTAREPRFELTDAGGEPRLTPIYDVIEQTGVDANWVSGGWLFKLEALQQWNRHEDYAAAAGGFEYTFASVRGSSWDAGVLAELLWDERGADGPSAFQKDIFLGTRLAANDIAGTEILAGVIVDLERDGLFGNVEASRRLGNAGRVTVELRLFTQTDPADPLDTFRRDDYLQIEYVHYF